MGEMLLAASAVAGYALTLSAFGPTAIGLTAVGVGLPLFLALSTLVLEVWPAWVQLRRATVELLKTPWIFHDELFANVKTVFSGNLSEPLLLAPGFRTLRSSDGAASASASSPLFIRARSSVAALWTTVQEVFGALPAFESQSQATQLAAGDVTIDSISNPDVRLVRHSGQEATFSTLSGKLADFTYRMLVRKEGFQHERVLSARVNAAPTYLLASTPDGRGDWNVDDVLTINANGVVTTIGFGIHKPVGLMLSPGDTLTLEARDTSPGRCLGNSDLYLVRPSTGSSVQLASYLVLCDNVSPFEAVFLRRTYTIPE
jgi:hypothetical protein